MISARPYLIRAIYEWIVDSGLTPYVLVNAEAENVTVPSQYVQDGKIILNVSPQAVRNLELTNDWVMFSARFGGHSMEVSLPPQTVVAIYAKENGRGMVFSDDDDMGDEPDVSSPDDEPPSSPPSGSGPSSSSSPKKRPNLRVIK